MWRNIESIIFLSLPNYRYVILYMTTTIGILHTRCMKKLNNLRAIYTYMQKPTHILDDLREEYMITVVDIINTYNTDQNDGSVLWLEYMARISSNNLFGQIDRMINDISDQVSVHDEYIGKLLHECDNAKTDEVIIKQPTAHCIDCGSTHGGQCTHDRTDGSGTVQTPQRKRHGSYDRGRHCRVALKKILTEITFSLPLNEERRIRDWFRQYPNNDITKVSCKTLRLTLRDTKLTKYNMYIPYILKILTGHTPLRISQEEQDMICKRAEAAFMILKDPYGNMPFYQYLVYKVVDLLYSSDVSRRDSILSCIHLQRKETTVKNDSKWRRACSLLTADEFYIYHATVLSAI